MEVNSGGGLSESTVAADAAAPEAGGGQRGGRREAKVWVVSIAAQCAARKATCTVCREPIDGGEARVAKAADHASRRQFKHWQCAMELMEGGDQIKEEGQIPQVVMQGLREKLEAAPGCNSEEAEEGCSNR